MSNTRHSVMKEDFSRLSSNGIVEFNCTIHGFLPSENWFPSDAKIQRKSCKACSTKRARHSSRGNQTKRVLSRFKGYCRRNGHGGDVKKWQNIDLVHILRNCDIVDDICMRPGHPENKVWLLNDVILIPKKDAKKRKFQHRRGARWIKGKSLAAMCLREANLSTGNTIRGEIQKE